MDEQTEGISERFTFPSGNAYREYLWNLVLNQNPFPNSRGNPTNFSLEDYSKLDIKGYATASAYTNPSKKDFPRDRNKGHKLHLNVYPENVELVSRILKDQGFDHKYLYGGEPKDGKIFT